MSWEKGAPRADPGNAASKNLDRSTSPVRSEAARGERGSMVHIIFLCLCMYCSFCPAALFLDAWSHHVTPTPAMSCCQLAGLLWAAVHDSRGRWPRRHHPDLHRAGHIQVQRHHQAEAAEAAFAIITHHPMILMLVGCTKLSALLAKIPKLPAQEL